MTTPKVDYRQLIRDGKITDHRAGQLIALDNYEGEGSILSESEESALRRGAKNTSILGDYIRGSNRLLRMEGNYLAAITEIDRDINYIQWALAATKHTAVVSYREPEVLVVTEEKYKKIAKEKYELRKKRTYRLITLYQAIIEDIIRYRRTEHKELVERLDKDAKDGKARGWEKDSKVYGSDLIENAWEIYNGWGGSEEGDFTLADFAEDIPDLHALVMDEMRQLFKDGKLSINPDSLKLEAYKDTKLSGEELDGIAIKRLQEWFTAIEGRDSVLDDYWQDQFISKHEQESAIIATKYQKYAILQNQTPNDVTEDGFVKNDLLTEIEFGPLIGYSKKREDQGKYDTGEVLIQRVTRCRNSIILNAKLLTMFVQFRLKAGRLMHIDKGDGFIYRTNNMFDLDERYRMYELWRGIYQVEDIQAHISDPKANEYLQRVQNAVAPLCDTIPTDNIKKGMTQEERSAIINSHYPSPEVTQEWINADPYVAKALVMVEEMELSNIERTSDRMLDLLRELVTKEEKPNEPVPEQG